MSGMELDAAAQRLRDLAVLRRVRDRIDREYAEPLNVEALARGANISAGHLSVTDVCFAVGSSSLGTFSTRFTELVGVPPSVYRRDHTQAAAGIPACLAKQVTRPIRNQEAQVVGRE